MEIKQLRIFQTAARELNFTRTAIRLGFAQSSITSNIKALEEELGVLLFERIGKRIFLTDEGLQFKSYVDQIMGLTEEVREVIGKNEEPSGKLTICASETHCTYRLPMLLHQFQEEYPKVELIFRPGISESEFKYLLSNGDVDVALLSMYPVESYNLIVEELVEEPIVLICSSNHPLTKKEKIVPKDLEDQALLLTEKCDYRKAFEGWLEAGDSFPKSRLELADVEAIKRCVIADVGIAVLPRIAVEREVKQGDLAILSMDGPHFPIIAQLFWHKDKWVSPSLKAFLNVTRKVIQSGVME